MSPLHFLSKISGLGKCEHRQATYHHIMSSIPPGFALSLRPWPKDNIEGSQLSSLIQRIYAERGDFRNLTEEGLEAEIDRENASGAEVEEDDAASSDSEDEPEPDRAKEVLEQKQQMMLWLQYVAIYIRDKHWCHILM